MSGRLGRHVIGRYGVGTLWCLRAPDAFFIQFNAIKIAKRPLKGDAWIGRLKMDGRSLLALTVKSASSCITARAWSFRSTGM
jgi:hypothetical protein